MLFIYKPKGILLSNTFSILECKTWFIVGGPTKTSSLDDKKDLKLRYDDEWVLYKRKAYSK